LIDSHVVNACGVGVADVLGVLEEGVEVETEDEAVTTYTAIAD